MLLLLLLLQLLLLQFLSDSVWSHRRQPTRLSHPWDSPGKNTGVGYHFLLQSMKVKSESEVAQSCPTETPWTAAHQALPSMGFSRQEYWSGVPLPSPISVVATQIIVWSRKLVFSWLCKFPCMNIAKYIDSVYLMDNGAVSGFEPCLVGLSIHIQILVWTHYYLS